MMMCTLTQFVNILHKMLHISTPILRRQQKAPPTWAKGFGHKPCEATGYFSPCEIIVIKRLDRGDDKGSSQPLGMCRITHLYAWLARPPLPRGRWSVNSWNSVGGRWHPVKRNSMQQSLFTFNFRMRFRTEDRLEFLTPRCVVDPSHGYKLTVFISMCPIFSVREENSSQATAVDEFRDFQPFPDIIFSLPSKHRRNVSLLEAIYETARPFTRLLFTGIAKFIFWGWCSVNGSNCPFFPV